MNLQLHLEGGKGGRREGAGFIIAQGASWRNRAEQSVFRGAGRGAKKTAGAIGLF